MNERNELTLDEMDQVSGGGDSGNRMKELTSLIKAWLPELKRIVKEEGKEAAAEKIREIAPTYSDLAARFVGLL